VTILKRQILSVLVVLSLVLVGLPAAAQDDLPPAKIANDEGGPVSITGSVTYTNLTFTIGVAEPLIILEDQAGFVDRNRGFLMPEESQVIGQITSDFYTSPFTYNMVLPIEPQASLRDVDNDGATDTGVMIYAIAYWSNTWGDPYLEERDLFGGGWSGAYASTRIDQNPSGKAELLGGTYLVYAPDDQQGFPSGFGEDSKLFTGDESVVRLPQGYTIVNMDTDPFTFDRSQHPVIDLIEGEGAEAVDFSSMSYTDAFDAMVEMFRNEYAYTEFKGMDWDALWQEYRPRFEEADANRDSLAYVLALRDFYWQIPDGHMRFPLTQQTIDLFTQETDGGLGIALAELDDGRVIVNFLGEGSPAAAAGIELGAEILAINNQSIDEAIAESVPWSSPFSAPHVLRLQQLRYITRFTLGETVTVKYRNPGADQPAAAEMVTSNERDSFASSSFNTGLSGVELPLEYQLIDPGIMYVKIYSFFDNALLTIQLWERMITAMNDNQIPALIIDMRQNGGGSGFLADQMAAYFFNEPLEVGNGAVYDPSLGEFYSDRNRLSRYYLPPEELRYNGPVVVLVGPNCNSACEYFSYDMTLQGRAEIVGQYPTGGLGGGQKFFSMPDGLVLQFSAGRNLDADDNIIVEGTGVPLDVKVPINEETVFADGDVVLDYAVDYLVGQ
jgi:C-terminal processing protease CtpA/Prc